MTSSTVGHFWGGRVGVSQKVTNSDGGRRFGLFSKPKVTSSTVVHFWGEVGGTPKVTKSDKGGGRVAL